MEQPEYVVFNGREGRLMGEGALKAKVGEKIRLFIGNGADLGFEEELRQAAETGSSQIASRE